MAPTAADTEWNVNGSRRCRMMLRISASRLALVIVVLRLPAVRELRREANVLTTRTLGALAEVERYGLPFAQFIEMRLGARRIVEEVFGAVTREGETETLVRDERSES